MSITPTLYLYSPYGLVNNTMDYSAFSHGQIQSKLWLCETLEPYLPEQAKVVILGSWYNILGFMMLTRNRAKYNLIMGIDQNKECVQVANHVINGWTIGDDYAARNQCSDVNKFNTNSFDVVINTSVEHIENTKWFENIKWNTTVCLQTSNMVTDDPNWNIVNPNPDIETFKLKYPMSQILFAGEKVFDYGHLKYSRYMIIGKK